MTRYDLNSADGTFHVDVSPADDGFNVSIDGHEYFVRLKRGASRGALVAELSDKPVGLELIIADPRRVELVIGGERLSYQRPAAPLGRSPPAVQAPSVQKDVVTAPMPGKVITALVAKGEKVKAGDPMVIIESMKMEVAIRADRDAEVEEILVEEGAAVKRGQALVRLS
ncbi:MAG: biotin/lipoyl-binding protein [Thaumarchaeota archaeon]|nr:biotin/lipoyl-binding protein [Nitrososphaerota archaeon]